MSWLMTNGEFASFVTQIAVLALCLLLGFLIRTNDLPGLCIGIGLITNVVAQIIMAGGGPGACVGFVAIPLMCLVCGYTGRGLRVLIVGRPPPPPPESCMRCGYSLTGNTSGVCPECGTAIPPAPPAA